MTEIDRLDTLAAMSAVPQRHPDSTAALLVEIIPDRKPGMVRYLIHDLGPVALDGEVAERALESAKRSLELARKFPDPGCPGVQA